MEFGTTESVTAFLPCGDLAVSSSIPTIPIVLIDRFPSNKKQRTDRLRLPYLEVHHWDEIKQGNDSP